MRILDIFRYASTGTIRLSIIAIAIAFVPCLALVSLRGLGPLKSFLLDWAAQSRFWIVIPLLIAAEPPLVERQKHIAQHFLDQTLVAGEDRTRLERARENFLRLGNSMVSMIALVLVVYLPIVSVLRYVKPGILLPWIYGGGGVVNLSPAGSWYVLVVFPLLTFLLLRWCWRQLLWAWFLRSVASTALRLIPSHPDSKAGLGFVETCLRAYFPFGFALGTLIAGGVANRIVYLHEPLTAFRYSPLFLIALVLVICVTPLCVFVTTLLRAKRQGIFQYGALATALGRKFEDKWLAASENQVDPAALDANDFSATTDLYSIVANVHHVNAVPVDVRTLVSLCVATLTPAIPVLFAALPFDVIMQQVLKHFL